MSDSVRLEPVTADRFEAWKASRRKRFQASLVKSGIAPDEAKERAARHVDSVVAEVGGTEGTHIWSILADDDEIGFVWSRVHDLSEGREAFVRELDIYDAFRNELGESAVAASEKRFAELGANWIRLFVVSGTVPFFEKLGYSRTLTTMSKPLAGHPRPDYGDVPDVRLEQMTQEQFDEYLQSVRQRNAVDYARAGVLPIKEAEHTSAADLDSLLPNGLQTKGHLLFTAYDGATPVGTAWFQLTRKADGVHAFGNEIRVPDDLRGRGYGRAILRATGDYLEQRQVVTVGGRVLGYNTKAKALFEEIGLKDQTVQLKKAL